MLQWEVFTPTVVCLGRSKHFLLKFSISCRGENLIGVTSSSACPGGLSPLGGDWSCPVPVQSGQPRWPLGTLGLCFAECQYLRILQREVCSRLQKPIQGTIRQEESVFFNEFQELVSKADPGGETGGKSVVTALEGRRILAQNWAEAEGLAPWFGGVRVPVLSFEC